MQAIARPACHCTVDGETLASRTFNATESLSDIICRRKSYALTFPLSGSPLGTQSEAVSKLSGFPVPSAACSLVILDRSVRVVFVTESSVQCEPKEKHEDYKNFHATLHSVLNLETMN